MTYNPSEETQRLLDTVNASARSLFEAAKDVEIDDEYAIHGLKRIQACCKINGFDIPDDEMESLVRALAASSIEAILSSIDSPDKLVRAVGTIVLGTFFMGYGAREEVEA